MSGGNVWKYFKRVNYVSKKTKIKSPRVKCLHKVDGKVCSKTISHSSSSTTSMLNHLKSQGISDFPNKNTSKIDNTNKVVYSSKGEKYEYDNLLLATGGRPIKINIPAIK